MGIQFLDHTADTAFRVTAPTVQGIFSQSLDALMQVLGPVPDREPGAVERRVTLTAPDQTSLVITFLNEALSLGQIHSEMYEIARVDALDGTSFSGVLKGRKVASFTGVVKGVTYHGAELVQSKRGEWEITVVLDV